MNSFQTAFSLDQHGTHIIIAIPLTASCIGAMCSGLLADSIGRRKSFVVAGCIDLLGTLLQTVTKSYVLLLLGRIIAGFAVGILCSLVPLYQSEISLPELRGRLITLYQLGITLGFCVAFWTGYSTYGISSDISWRLPIYLQILPPVLFLAGLLLVPESPRWLIYQGQSEKALKILKSIRINKENSYQYNISMEYTGIIQNVNYDRRCSAEKLSSLWSRGIENNLKRTILGISMHVTTQFTGINTILLSIPILINNNGSNIAISPQLGQAIGGLLNMIATLPVFFYIDSFGRRKILITGALTMSLCMIVLAIITGAERGGAGSANLESVVGHHNDFFTSNSSSTLFILFFAILCAFIVCFSLSFGTLSWVYPAEIYTQLIRAKAIGVTTAASFCSQLFISELSPIMIHSSLLATYIFFGVMCIFIAWTVFCFYPETNVSEKVPWLLIIF
ncbi:general substrate transporter [Spinellus fusiger]|nr:general substrate transporter [Spinellus fusiger]